MNKLRCLRWWPVLLWISACASRPGVRPREFRERIDESPVFGQSFTGFALYDTERREMIHTYQADKYYTPASNTKIFTLYASLMLLGDSIPALRYGYRGDTLVFTGTGDPMLLHPELPSIDTTYDRAVYRFLRRHEGPLRYSARPIDDAPFGPGWAWDDYNYYYSTEKSVMPVYANVVRFRFEEHLASPFVTPRYFADRLNALPDTTLKPARVRRTQFKNCFTYGPVDTLNAITDVPFIQSIPVLLQLLRDTLEHAVQRSDQPYWALPYIRYSLPVDSLYRRMMHQSDNFVAEQLLLLGSSIQRDTLSTEWTINHVTKCYLSDLPDEPVWVDGSGLSRYNLQTPRTMVAILQKVDSVLGDERIRTIFPAGGESGTIEDWYANPSGEPYVFAKTGTLGGKHCLSGFLFTRAGRKLIFSFMHNNYVTSSSVFKEEMEHILQRLYEAY